MEQSVNNLEVHSRAGEPKRLEKEMNAKIEEALKNLNLNNEDLQKVRGIMIEEKVERVMEDLEIAHKKSDRSTLDMFCPCCTRSFLEKITETLKANKVNFSKFANYLISKGIEIWGGGEGEEAVIQDINSYPYADKLEVRGKERNDLIKAEFIAAVRAGLE